MGEIFDSMKGMIGLVIITPLAGAAIGTVAGIGALSGGIGGATQAVIGGGLLHSASKMFKF